MQLDEEHGPHRIVALPRVAPPTVFVSGRAGAYERREHALAFGLNMLAIGDTIVCGARVPRIQSILTARGYHYRIVPLDQFHLAGGSAACLVAVVHRDPNAR
jgi:hypothetical protein